MEAFRISAPQHALLIIAPGAFLPIVGLYSISQFRAAMRGQRGVNRAIASGTVRFPVAARYDRTARQMVAFERDCLNRLHLVVNPIVPLGLVHSCGTDDLERDMRRLFQQRDDAQAAAADVLRMMLQLEQLH